jgi:hypothetical protein
VKEEEAENKKNGMGIAKQSNREKRVLEQHSAKNKRFKFWERETKM